MSHPARKIVASLLLVAFMAAWIVTAATIGGYVAGWPKWAEVLFYVVAGIGWIAPFKPVFAWMNSNAEPEDD